MCAGALSSLSLRCVRALLSLCRADLTITIELVENGRFLMAAAPDAGKRYCTVRSAMSSGALTVHLPAGRGGAVRSAVQLMQALMQRLNSASGGQSQSQSRGGGDAVIAQGAFDTTALGSGTALISKLTGL